MRIIAKKALREFREKHNDSKEQLKTWYKDTSNATWTSAHDLKCKYVKASILKE